MQYFKSILIFVLLFSASSVFASTTDGTVSGSAWNDQIGWINFGTTNGNVRVTNSAITGYAWSENTGRINLAPTNSGVVNTTTGALSGYAWAEGTGWINFAGVRINCDGKFVGDATGDNIGQVSFSCPNCSITTDWRPSLGCGAGAPGTAPAEAEQPTIIERIQEVVQEVIQTIIQPFIPQTQQIATPSPQTTPVVTEGKKSTENENIKSSTSKKSETKTVYSAPLKTAKILFKTYIVQPVVNFFQNIFNFWRRIINRK